MQLGKAGKIGCAEQQAGGSVHGGYVERMVHVAGVVRQEWIFYRRNNVLVRAGDGVEAGVSGVRHGLQGVTGNVWGQDFVELGRKLLLVKAL